MEAKEFYSLPIVPILIKMKVKETRTWPIARLAAVIDNASLLCLIKDRDYSYNVNREKGVIEVTREE